VYARHSLASVFAKFQVHIFRVLLGEVPFVTRQTSRGASMLQVLLLLLVEGFHVVQSFELTTAVVDAQGSIEGFEVIAPHLVRREALVEDLSARLPPAVSLPRLQGEGDVGIKLSNSSNRTHVLTLANNNTAQSAKLLKDYQAADAIARRGCALSFIGALLFFISISYMSTQTISSDLQECSLNLIAGIVSLFFVVLCFMIGKKVWKLGLAPSDPEVEEIVGSSIGVVRGLLLLWCTPLFCRRLKADSAILAGFKQIGSHLIGFAGADALADLLRHAPWTDSPTAYAGGCVLYSLAVLFVMWISSLCFRPREDSRRRAIRQSFYDPAILNEQLEACGFIVGFLGCLCIRYVITGFVPGDVSGRALTDHDLKVMFGVCCCCFMLYAFMAGAVRPMAYNDEDDEKWSPITRLLAKFCVESSAMLAAWNYFYLVQWAVWHKDHEEMYATTVVGRLNALLECAVIMSFSNIAVLLLVVAICWGHDYTRAASLTELNNGLVLLTGFAWEICFYMAMHENSILEFPTDTTKQRETDLIFMVAFVIVLLPTFIWVIVPATLMRDFSQKDQGEDAGSAQVTAPVEGKETKDDSADKKDATGTADVAKSEAAAASSSAAAPSLSVTINVPANLLQNAQKDAGSAHVEVQMDKETKDDSAVKKEDATGTDDVAESEAAKSDTK